MLYNVAKCNATVGYYTVEYSVSKELLDSVKWVRKMIATIIWNADTNSV